MQFLNFKIKSKIFAAPMAGITDLSFRKILRDCGAEVLYTEMISAKALCYNDKKTLELLKTDGEDSPLIVQLFGHEPEVISKAAGIIGKMGFSAIDINMGCPAPKIVKNGEGSALMKNPELIEKIVKSTVDSVPLPVTVKLRCGYDRDNINAAECAKAAQSGGASAVCIHGRTREQFYSGEADLDIIKKVKDTVKIPVIGNGDIFSPEQAEAMLVKTGCDFVMAGRGLLGAPFLITQINDYFESGSYNKNISLDYKISLIKKHLDLLLINKDERHAILEFRKHLAWYLKGTKNSKKYREAANRIMQKSDVYALLEVIREDFDFI